MQFPDQSSTNQTKRSDKIEIDFHDLLDQGFQRYQNKTDKRKQKTERRKRAKERTGRSKDLFQTKRDSEVNEKARVDEQKNNEIDERDD